MSEREEVRKALLSWHGWLTSERHRRERAELRRLDDPLNAVFTDGYRDLLNRVEADRPLGERARLDYCRAAALLAHVKEHDGSKRVAAAMASPRNGSPRVSKLRFRRLIGYRDEDKHDLFLTLQRTLKLLEHRANVIDLANSILFWNEKTRRDWAFAYFNELHSSKSKGKEPS